MNVLEPLIEMTSPHTDFIGQRADKSIVKDISDVKEVKHPNGIIVNGVLKELHHYTVSCNECGGDGYYDDIGEIICEGCGMVLSGDKQPVIQTEYSENEGHVAKGRGVEKMNDTQFGHEPSI